MSHRFFKSKSRSRNTQELRYHCGWNFNNSSLYPSVLMRTILITLDIFV